MNCVKGGIASEMMDATFTRPLLLAHGPNMAACGPYTSEISSSSIDGTSGKLRVGASQSSREPSKNLPETVAVVDQASPPVPCDLSFGALKSPVPPKIEFNPPDSSSVSSDDLFSMESEDGDWNKDKNADKNPGDPKHDEERTFTVDFPTPFPLSEAERPVETNSGLSKGDNSSFDLLNPSEEEPPYGDVDPKLPFSVRSPTVLDCNDKRRSLKRPLSMSVGISKPQKTGNNIDPANEATAGITAWNSLVASLVSRENSRDKHNHRRVFRTSTNSSSSKSLTHNNSTPFHHTPFLSLSRTWPGAGGQRPSPPGILSCFQQQANDELENEATESMTSGDSITSHISPSADEEVVAFSSVGGVRDPSSEEEQSNGSLTETRSHYAADMMSYSSATTAAAFVGQSRKLPKREDEDDDIEFWNKQLRLERLQTELKDFIVAHRGLQCRFTVRVMDKNEAPPPLEYRIYQTAGKQDIPDNAKPKSVLYGVDAIVDWIQQWVEHVDWFSAQLPPVFDLWFDATDIHMFDVEVQDAREFIIGDQVSNESHAARW